MEGNGGGFDLADLRRVLREGGGRGAGAVSQPKRGLVGQVKLYLVLLCVAWGEEALICSCCPLITPKGEPMFSVISFRKKN